MQKFCLKQIDYESNLLPMFISTLIYDLLGLFWTVVTEEPAYPYLKTLLRFDTREFFNVLALAFEETEFRSEEGMDKRQRVVDILLQIMVESIGFSPTQIGILFTFLARQMARHENSIIVNRVLFEQVLESLCVQGDSDSDSRHEERQQALIELLGAGGLEHFNENRLLRLAENAKFYRVCESLYRKRKEYDKILSCYWRDQARRHQSFSYIEHIMTSDHYTNEDKLKVQQEALSHLKELVCIDSKKTAQLILVGFSDKIPEIVNMLRSEEKLLLELLRGLCEQRENSFYSERQQSIEPDIHELYIELLCKYDPSSVYVYIMKTEGFRLQETLEICQRYKLPEATAHLLEKSGDIQGAFDIILQTLQGKLQDLVTVVESSADPETKPQQEFIIEQNLSVCWAGVQSVLLVLIQLCQRHSNTMEDSQKEALWFPLLDAVMGSQKKLKDISKPSDMEEFKEITRHLLNSMMGYIPLQTILQKIMQDPAYSTGKFGEVKELLLGMLDTYNYEKTLLHTCNNLVNHDLYRQLAVLTQTASRGTVPKMEACCLCSKPFMAVSDNESVVCFRCGHGYHTPCLRSVHSLFNIDGEVTWICYLCNKTKRRGNVSGARTQRLPSNPSTQPQKVKATGSGDKNKEPSSLLDAEQIHAVDNLRRVQKTSSRLAILTELARQERAGGPLKYRPHASSIFHNEQFQLRLAHPPPDFSS